MQNFLISSISGLDS